VKQGGSLPKRAKSGNRTNGERGGGKARRIKDWGGFTGCHPAPGKNKLCKSQKKKRGHANDKGEGKDPCQGQQGLNPWLLARPPGGQTSLSKKKTRQKRREIREGQVLMAATGGEYSDNSKHARHGGGPRKKPIHPCKTKKKPANHATHGGRKVRAAEKYTPLVQFKTPPTTRRLTQKK